MFTEEAYSLKLHMPDLAQTNMYPQQFGEIKYECREWLKSNATQQSELTALQRLVGTLNFLCNSGNFTQICKINETVSQLASLKLSK